MGSVTYNVPVGHPDFGQAFACPECDGGPEIQARRRANIERFFRAHWLNGTHKLAQHTMTDFVDLEDALQVGKGDAITLADQWARGEAITYADIGAPAPTQGEFTPSNALVLSGEPGRGKTCLAAAAYSRRAEGRAGLAIEYNALMDALIGEIDGGNVSALVRAASGVPLLFLDDLGNTFVQAETQGRQRWLFEIVNHRYNRNMPTIITTNLNYWALVDQFSLKLAERLLERAVWCEVGGPSLRIAYGGE